MDLSPAPLQSHWQNVRGRRLHALAYIHRTSETSAAVLVHGLGVSSRHMIPVAKELVSYLDVFVPDLPGFGQSEKPDRVLGLDELADWTADGMLGMGLSRCVLLGNSVGCQIIVRLAIRHPSLVSALILASPTIEPSERTTPRQLRAFARGAHGRSPEMAWVILRDYARCGAPRLLATLQMAIDDRIEDRLGQVRVPTLVVRGSRDTLVSPAWAREVTRRLPDGRLAVVPGGGHALNFEAARRLRKLTIAFLKERGLLQEGHVSTRAHA